MTRATIHPKNQELKDGSPKADHAMNMNDPVYIIAEVGMAHDGSLGIAHALIAALAECGVDGVKFQVHFPEESSEHEPFRIPFSYADQSRMDYWDRTAFTATQWTELQAHCKASAMHFVASPFSVKAADMLHSIGATRIKIGSGEVANLLMIRRVCDFATHIYISSGMSNWQELDKTIHYIQQYEIPFSILQCSSHYPTKPTQWGLNVIAEMRARYASPIGFSDHSGDVHACLAAVALGAKVVECHVNFDKRCFGPDSSSSLTIDQMKFLVKGIRQIEIALQNPVNKTDLKSYQYLREIFGKSLSVNQNLSQGHCIQRSDLESKKPARHGIAPDEFEKLIGRPLKTDIRSGNFLNFTDLIL